tara:strand:- start:2042 stop:3271 length:1230 start_codon:yes stop_codon:yes gene_type:complete
MKKKISRLELIYGYILIMTSGNPFFTSKTLLVFIFIVLLFTLNLKKDFVFIKYLISFIGFSLFIFILQYFHWGQLPISFVSGYFVRVVIGAILFYKLRFRLPLVLWKVVVYSSLLALPFYFIHLFIGNFFDIKSVILYTFRPIHTGETIIRNSGFAWEPGVFQIYINIVLFLNLNYISRFKKWELLVLILSLLTTFSSTGYLIFFMICIVFLNSSRDITVLRLKSLKPLLLIIIIGVFVSIFFNSDFLKNKLVSQTSEISTFEGEFSQNRFLTFLFDLKYIKMNPILGNGYNFEMRYTAEDKRFIENFLELRDQEGDSLGAANGLSDMISRFGFLYVIIFFSFFYRRLKMFSTKKRLYILLLILLFLWGEPMMNFPFFLALPFISFYNGNLNIKELRDYNRLENKLKLE